MDLMSCNDDEEEWFNWANLVGYEEVIAIMIQEVEGDPKTV